MISRTITTLSCFALALVVSSCEKKNAASADAASQAAEFDATVDQLANDIEKSVAESAEDITEENADEALTELEEMLEGDQ